MKKTPNDIQQLGDRISELKRREAEARKDKKESEAAYASKVGFRIATEMLSGVVVGAAIGYLLDNMMQTKPWLLMVFMFFGGAAGVLNVYRFAKGEDKKRRSKTRG